MAGSLGAGSLPHSFHQGRGGVGFFLWILVNGRHPAHRLTARRLDYRLNLVSHHRGQGYLDSKSPSRMLVAH